MPRLGQSPCTQHRLPASSLPRAVGKVLTDEKTQARRHYITGPVAAPHGLILEPTPGSTSCDCAAQSNMSRHLGAVGRSALWSQMAWVRSWLWPLLAV